MFSEHKRIEYLTTANLDLFAPEYCYDILSKMRYYKNSRRKNRIKTIQETIGNYSRHLIKKKARKKAINKRNKKKHIGVK